MKLKQINENISKEVADKIVVDTTATLVDTELGKEEKEKELKKVLTPVIDAAKDLAKKTADGAKVIDTVVGMDIEEPKDATFTESLEEAMDPAELNLKNKLENFAAAAHELTEAWEQAQEYADTHLSDSYPFDKSFDQVVLDIDAWVNSVLDESLKEAMDDEPDEKGTGGYWDLAQKVGDALVAQEVLPGMTDDIQDAIYNVLKYGLKDDIKDVVCKNEDLKEDVEAPKSDLEIELEDADKLHASEMGVAGLLNALIKDEWEAIDGYNSAMETIRAIDVHTEIINILNDIKGEEMIHVGQLQEAMKLVDIAANNIADGEAEAKEDGVQDNIEVDFARGDFDDYADKVELVDDQLILK